MTINATLFIQIINFIVAYFLIKHILLKPAVVAIDLEDKNLNRLHNQLEKAEGSVSVAEQAQSTAKEKAQEKFHSKWPSFKKGEALQVVGAPERPEISKETVSSLANAVTSAITKKVADV